MKTYKMKSPIYWFVSLIILNSACADFLDEKSNERLTIPSTLSDMQALLEHPTSLNGNDGYEGEASSDDLFVPPELANNLNEIDHNVYTFANEFVNPELGNTWYWCYTNLYRMNTVLDHLPSIERTTKNALDWDNVKGQAHFWRAHFYFQLASIYCLPYQSSESTLKPGLPLRKNANFQEIVERSSLSETYSFIIEELKSAIALLPTVAVHVVRPSKKAALALMARVYMSMGEYDDMLTYANLCLGYGDDIINYNDVDTNAPYPFESYFEEVLFHSVMRYNALVRANTRIPQSILDLYAEDDLRRKAFFQLNRDGFSIFKGNYSGTGGYFSGIAIDEVILMKIEGLIRKDNLVDAAAEFNRFVETRYVADRWIKIVFHGRNEALDILLQERRKQLLMRGLRWLDIRRLNMEGYEIDVVHQLGSERYVLGADSKRMAFPIPEEVIERGLLAQNQY